MLLQKISLLACLGGGMIESKEQTRNQVKFKFPFRHSSLQIQCMPFRHQEGNDTTIEWLA